MTCVLEAHPMPDITWYHGNTIISQSHRVQIASQVSHGQREKAEWQWGVARADRGQRLGREVMMEKRALNSVLCTLLSLLTVWYFSWKHNACDPDAGSRISSVHCQHDLSIIFLQRMLRTIGRSRKCKSKRKRLHISANICFN